MRLVWPHDDPSEGCEQRGGIMRVWYKICPGPGSDAGMQNWLPIVQLKLTHFGVVHCSLCYNNLRNQVEISLIEVDCSEAVHSGVIFF